MASIYGLHHPLTGELRYIGKANNPAQRLLGHMRNARTETTPVYCWIRKLVAAGLKPIMRVMEVADNWQEAEKRLIAVHRQGGRLLNVADGGDEPACSLDVRRMNGKRMQTHPNTAISRKLNGARLVEALKADPRKMCFRNFYRVIVDVRGSLARRGAVERVVKLDAAIEKLKALQRVNPDRLYELIQSKTGLRNATSSAGAT